jgi:hypothetical protein
MRLGAGSARVYRNRGSTTAATDGVRTPCGRMASCRAGTSDASPSAGSVVTAPRVRPRGGDMEDVMATPNTEQLKQQVHQGLEMLKTLRDEIRVELHLAGMDAKAKWKELEPRFEEAERRAKDLSEVSRVAVDEAVKKLRDFRDSLKKKS